jgi:hypothetical protein
MLLKLVVKIALIPVFLAWTGFKALLAFLAGAVALVIIGPLVLGLGLALLVPLLVLGGLVWACIALIGAF